MTFAPGEICFAFHMASIQQAESPIGDLIEKAKRRDIVEGGQGCQLREAAADYKRLFEAENEDIGLKSAYFRKPNVQ